MDLIKKFIFLIFFSIYLNAFAQGPIDLNTADKATLMMVKGIGESRAQAIITYRQLYGPFSSVDELAEVDGIGQATVDANRDVLIVSKQ